MEFPDEILLSIFAPLERINLKSLRLVSKIWCECASMFLFDQIYVSSAKEDLEVFESVTQSPLLSRCVSHLKYDATEFLEALTERQYIAELWTQRPWVYYAEDHPRWYTHDLEVNDWVNNGILGNMSPSEVTARFQHSQLIKRGYQSYKEHAKFQQAALESGLFLRKLARGLHKLERLKEVTLEGTWKYAPEADELSGSGERCTGSYLARHWNRFYCKPRGWRWENTTEDLDEELDLFEISPDGIQSYKIITTALVQAQCHIISFTAGNDNDRLCPGLPSALFSFIGQTAWQRKEIFSIGLTAFANLERFVIHRFAACEEDVGGREMNLEYLINIEGLSVLLGSMNHLKHLQLKLSGARDDLFYDEEQVLPREKIWPNLESLTLTNISITARSLLHLLLYRTPNILHLQIGYISLLEGSWEAFFEALSQSKQLHSFNLVSDNELWYHGGERIWKQKHRSTFFEVLADYVIHGGRHPCLDDHQPDSAAHEWLQEFDPTVQERIVQSCLLNTGSAI